MILLNLDVMELLIVSDCLTIIICGVMLIASPKYDEGFFGHVALAGMIFGAAIIVSGILLGNVEYRPIPEMLLALTGAAVFLGNTACRMLGRDRRAAPGQGRAAVPYQQKILSK